jgi:hypothetical protein
LTPKQGTGRLLTHSDLAARKALIDSDGILWALLPDGSRERVLDLNAVAVDFRPLIGASLILYAANSVVAEGLAKVVEWAEGTGNDTIVDAVTTFEANLNVSRRCAIEGLQNIAAMQKRG